MNFAETCWLLFKTKAAIDFEAGIILFLLIFWINFCIKFSVGKPFWAIKLNKSISLLIVTPWINEDLERVMLLLIAVSRSGVEVGLIETILITRSIDNWAK